MISGIVLTDPINVIEKKILEAMRTQLNKIFPQVVDRIRNDISLHLQSIYKNTSTYKSLLNGELQAHFGLPYVEAVIKLNSIVETLGKSVQVDFTRLSIRGNTIHGGLNIYAIQADMEDILSLDDANVVTEKQQVLPWLEWLLVEGDRIIVHNYVIRFGGYVSSRSGKALMFESKGGVWRVPPKYSGTLSDNWITRTISDYETLIGQMMSYYIQTHVERII